MMIALFALAVAAPPLGADWTIVAETDAGVMAIDPASVEADGDGRSVWTRAAFIDSDGLAATVVALNHVDCARRTSARLRVLSLDEGGTEIAVVQRTLEPSTDTSMLFVSTGLSILTDSRPTTSRAS